MFKKEINFLTDLNVSRLQLLGDRLSINDIVKSDIHPAIIKFVSSSIDFEIFQDRKKIEKESIFNYNNDRIQNYFLLIGQEIKRTQIFDFEYIRNLVQNAIVFNVNYLAKPNSTLEHFIFGQDEIKSIEEIILGLSRVYYFKYLQKILYTYIDKKQVVLMRRKEFSELLIRIDEISRETHLESTVLTAINSITNFFDQSAKNSERLPLIALQKYFDEKKYTEYSDRLFELYGDDPSLVLYSSDVVLNMKSVIPVSEILVEDSKNIEDQFTPAKENEDIIYNVFETKNTQIMEVNENSTTDVDEIFEVSHDDAEIPNHEILSNDQIGENLSIDVNKDDELKDKDKAESIDIDKTNTSPDSNDDEIKKKANLIAHIDELTNIDNLYHNLESTETPFDDKTQIITTDDFIDENQINLDYQLDLSTLDEDVHTERKIIKIDNHTSDFENNIFSKDSRDDIIDEQEDIDEILMLNKEFNELDYSNNQNPELDEEVKGINIIDEEKLVLHENEETTEVFTDLIYLDKEDKENKLAEHNQDSSEIEYNTNLKEESYSKSTVTETTNDSTFEDVIVTHDMSRIIENIFDYDMEEFHSIIDQITNSSNQTEAIKIAEKYCKENHIDLYSDDVESFKSIISEYFSQTYS